MCTKPVSRCSAPCSDTNRLNFNLASDGVVRSYGVSNVIPYTCTTQIRRGKYAGQDGTEDTADTMHTEYVQ